MFHLTRPVVLSIALWRRHLSKNPDISGCQCLPILIVYLSIEPFGGEGNGAPLQHSRLEKPMDGGAWRAAVRGVPPSRTRLRRLSSSSSSSRLVQMGKNLPKKKKKNTSEFLESHLTVMIKAEPVTSLVLPSAKQKYKTLSSKDKKKGFLKFFFQLKHKHFPFFHWYQ